jgi:hypothetical protein
MRETVMHQETLASINFSQGLSNAWSSVAQFVPKFIGFLVILIIGWFVAKVVSRALDAVLRRIGFERVAEHGGISRALARSSYDTTAMVARIVYYALLLVTLQLGFGVFGPNPISTMINGVVSWLPKGIVALAIIVVAAAIARVVRELVGGALSSLSYGRALATVASVFVLGLGIIAALGQADIATSVTGPVLVAVLATIAGILIVGVGGGLIQPMRERCERLLTTAERDAHDAAAGISAYQQGRADAMSGQQAAPRPVVSATGAAGMSTGTGTGMGMGTGSSDLPMPPTS